MKNKVQRPKTQGQRPKAKDQRPKLNITSSPRRRSNQQDSPSQPPHPQRATLLRKLYSSLPGYASPLHVRIRSPVANLQSLDTPPPPTPTLARAAASRSAASDPPANTQAHASTPADLPK